MQGTLNLFDHAISAKRGNFSPSEWSTQVSPNSPSDWDKTPNMVRWKRGEYADPAPLYGVVWVEFIEGTTALPVLRICHTKTATRACTHPIQDPRTLRRCQTWKHTHVGWAPFSRRLPPASSSSRACMLQRSSAAMAMKGRNRSVRSLRRSRAIITHNSCVQYVCEPWLCTCTCTCAGVHRVHGAPAWAVDRVGWWFLCSKSCSSRAAQPGPRWWQVRRFIFSDKLPVWEAMFFKTWFSPLN